MGAYTSGADVAPYISNRADFQRLQDTITKTTLKFMQPKDNGNDKIDSTIISFKDKPSFGLNYEIPTNVGLNYEIPTKKES